MLCVEGLLIWVVNIGNVKGFFELFYEFFVLDLKIGMLFDEDCVKFVWLDYYFIEVISVVF